MEHCSHGPTREADSSSVHPNISRGSPNAPIAPRATLRNRGDPSTFHTGSPRPAPKRVPGVAAPPGRTSRPQVSRLRPGPAKIAIPSTSTTRKGHRQQQPSGIQKPAGEEDKKRADGGSDATTWEWLERMPAKFMTVLVNMQEQHAASVNELREELERKSRRHRAEMRFALGALERVGERVDGHEGVLAGVGRRLDEHRGLLASVVEGLWEEEEGGIDLGDGDGDGEVVVETGGCDAMDVGEMDVDRQGSDGVDVDHEGQGQGEGEDEDEDCRGENVPTSSHLNMDVPPTPLGERQPVRSTGRKVVRRRPGTKKTPLPLRQGANKQTRPTATTTTTAPTRPSPEEEEEPPRQGSAGGRGAPNNINNINHDDDDDEDDDALRMLDGAPRLSALLRRQHGIASPPKSRPRPAYVEMDSDGDEDAEYRPCSPSSESASSSASSSSPSAASASIASWAPKGSPAALRRIAASSSPSSSSSAQSSTPKGPKTTAAAAATAAPPPSSSSSPTAPLKTPSTQPSPSKPRYSTPRHTTLRRINSGPLYAGEFTFRRMGRTVLSVWDEYKVSKAVGDKDFRCIESLEKEYGTYWRTGSVRDIKYASNYVGVRKKIVDFVEGMCEGGKMIPEEACAKLDERVDGRLQVLITVLRKGLDPFKEIPMRGGGSVSP